MRTRLVWIVGLSIVAACGKGSGKAGTGSGSGSAVAVAPKPPPVDAAPAVVAPPPPPACFPADFSGKLEALTASDTAATICAVNDAKASHCLAIQLASGKALEVPHPPAPAPPAMGGFTVKEDATQVAICKGATCVKLALAPLPAAPEGQPPATHGVAIAPSGLVAAAPMTDADLPAAGSGSGKGPPPDRVRGMALFETSSGGRMKVIPPGPDDYKCFEPARFLGADTLYVTRNVCAGPGARGALYKLDGTLIGSLADDYNVEGGEPIHLDGDAWAVPTFGGGGALVFDIKRGLALRGIQKVGDGFHLCDGCTPLADASAWSASPLARTPAGKLVEVSATGGVSLVDPASGKIESAWPLPVCPR